MIFYWYRLFIGISKGVRYLGSVQFFLLFRVRVREMVFLYQFYRIDRGREGVFILEVVGVGFFIFYVFLLGLCLLYGLIQDYVFCFYIYLFLLIGFGFLLLVFELSGDLEGFRGVLYFRISFWGVCKLWGWGQGMDQGKFWKIIIKNFGDIYGSVFLVRGFFCFCYQGFFIQNG